MNKLPHFRNKDIVVQKIGQEVLLYDLSIDRAYCLNETLSIIYQHCDGKTPFDKLKSSHQLTDEIIFLALDQLQERELLDGEAKNYLGALSRREAIRKVGLSSLIALPAIAFLVAPTAAQTASCRTNGQSCTPTNSGQGNCCSSTSRCFNNTCVNCFGTGVVFAAAPTTGACADNPQRNLCCNTTTPPSGGNGPACLCP